MLVRTRRIKNSVNGSIIHEGGSSLNEDTEMSPPAKSMVGELRTWMDNRLQERLETYNENIQSGTTMVQTDTTTQLLLEILNDQNDRMKKLEQAMTNTELFTQNIATLVKGITQGITT